ncbi:MAG: hypothetical protein JRG77_05655 [Deltaproteobacteria bacterium]|nr:hypothetical protein [Deltaproteobacteria bacterium]
MDHSKYSYEPVISCLEAVAFFRVSKLTHRGPERRCNPARDRNPAKGKPLLRQGTDGILLWGKLHRLKRSVRRMQRGQDIPMSKALRKQGAEWWK